MALSHAPLGVLPSTEGDKGGARASQDDQARQRVLLAGQEGIHIREGIKETVELIRRVGMAVPSRYARLAAYAHWLPAQPGHFEVDIRTTHNGLCHSDMHMRDDDWGFAAFPFIPGHEVVGVVEAVGNGVTHLQPGMRVGVGWIKDSCRHCIHCMRGEDNVCLRGYTGTILQGALGGFQDVLRVPADFAHLIPPGLSSEHAAPLLCAGLTVYAPLKRYIPRPGARVAVLGVGGLGHLAIPFASALGASVTAIVLSMDQKDEVRELGASSFMTWEDAQANCKDAFDVLINCASAEMDAGLLLAMLRPAGTLIQVGLPGGDVRMSVPLVPLVTGAKRVVGTIVGGRGDMSEMLELAADKGIKPLIELMPLSKVNEAMERVAAGAVRYRIVLTSDTEQLAPPA